jgi:hypothetical protein
LSEESPVGLAFGFLPEPMDVEIVVNGADDLGMAMSNLDGEVDEIIEIGTNFRLEEKAMGFAFATIVSKYSPKTC